jgi:hypothetical protein
MASIDSKVKASNIIAMMREFTDTVEAAFKEGKANEAFEACLSVRACAEVLKRQAQLDIDNPK